MQQRVDGAGDAVAAGGDAPEESEDGAVCVAEGGAGIAGGGERAVVGGGAHEELRGCTGPRARGGGGRGIEVVDVEDAAERGPGRGAVLGHGRAGEHRVGVGGDIVDEIEAGAVEEILVEAGDGGVDPDVGVTEANDAGAAVGEAPNDDRGVRAGVDQVDGIAFARAVAEEDVVAGHEDRGVVVAGAREEAERAGDAARVDDRSAALEERAARQVARAWIRPTAHVLSESESAQLHGGG